MFRLFVANKPLNPGFLFFSTLFPYGPAKDDRARLSPFRISRYEYMLTMMRQGCIHLPEQMDII